MEKEQNFDDRDRLQELKKEQQELKRILESIASLIEIVATLRGPGGCPWDKEQNHSSIRFNAIEESYELVDAIEKSDDKELCEELGDLLLQVVLHAQIARERGAFSLVDVVEGLTSKLIYRHPHVFGTKQIESVETLLKQWDKLKQQERMVSEGRGQQSSIFDGIPQSLPALMRAEQLLKRARRNGFLLPIKSDVISLLSKYDHKQQIGEILLGCVVWCIEHKLCAEELLRTVLKELETKLREQEIQLKEQKGLS